MDCPYCKEEIKDGAIKCKHCGSSIEAPVEVAMVDLKKKQSSGVQSLINDGYTLNISSYFSKSWDVFKKYPGGFIGFTVLWLVVVLIPIVGSFVQFFLQSVIISGYYFVYKKISQGERYQFNNFFDGFSYKQNNNLK